MTNNILPAGATIGIIGGGQLGRMLAMAATHMGYQTHIYVPEANSPAAQVATHSTVAPYGDEQQLLAFAGSVDVVTFEFENIALETLRSIADAHVVHPSPDVLEICNNRIREKDFISNQGVAVAAYAAAYSSEDAVVGAVKVGFPCVMKTAEEGYDGKGQVIIKNPDQVEEAWQRLNTTEVILEAWVPFTHEISVIVARNQAGEMATYEAAYNIHRNHILYKTILPAPVSEAVKVQADEIAKKLAGAMELVGIMAVEMFVTELEDVLVNELAPRPHNSGHWTIEAARTSQFEQHVRAITGHGLGDPSRLCDVEMINLIGEEVQDLAAYQSDPNAHIHLYGKKDIRPGRKMGHVTMLKQSV